MDTVGAYRLLRQIGEGGMGVVHLALAPDGSRVAVKVLRPQVIGDGEARRRLEREVAAMRRIRSPRVAEFVEADPWGDPPFVVTRYVAGLSLTEHVAEYGPLSGPKLSRFAGGTAEALAGVHAAGVLHRDVKPSNVLLDRDEPVLIDFGLAMSGDESRMTHAGWVFGTPAYLAPEVVLGEAPTAAVDVHGWAATVGFAATGRSPYGSGPSIVVLDRIRRGDYSVAGVPGPLDEVLRRCLDPQPHLRPTIAELCRWLAQLGALIPSTLSQPAVPITPRSPDGVTTGQPFFGSTSSVGHPLGEPTTVRPAGRSLAAASSHAASSHAASSHAASSHAASPVGAPGVDRPDGYPGDPAGPSDAPFTGVRGHGAPRTTAPTAGQWSPGAGPPGYSGAAVHQSGVTPTAANRPDGSWWQPEAAEPMSVRMLQWLAGLGAGAVVAAAVALAPYATTVLVAVLLVSTVASFATSDRRQRLEARRGPRSRDGFVSVMVWPLRALHALPVALLACFVSLVAALSVSAVQALISPGPDGSSLLGGVVFAALLWIGPVSTSLRRAGRAVTRAVLTPPAAGAVTVLVLAVAALLLVALAAESATVWSPSDGSPWQQLGRSL